MRAQTVLVAAVVLLALACSSRQAAVSIVNAAVRPLDIVLLLDQSGSMRGNDPENNRIVASKALIRYLAGFWSPTLDHRLGVVNFGDRLPADPADEVMPLLALDSVNSARGELISARLEAMDLGNTNFVNALRRAAELFAGARSDESRQRAVVILTDGQPDDTRRLTQSQYFDELTRFFGDSMTGCHLYVLGIDQKNQFWSTSESYWRRIARYTQRLSSSDEKTMNQAFFQVAALALEGIADTWRTRPSKTGLS